MQTKWKKDWIQKITSVFKKPESILGNFLEFCINCETCKKN